jgi:hypothetical protein
MSDLHFRLWTGFRRTGTAWNRFADDLAKTFVPATWQVMRRYGLLSYVPTLFNEQRPAGIPDEVALLVYRTEGEYKLNKQTVAGRSYGVMHGAIFEFAGDAAGVSDSTVPTPWPGGNGGPKPRKGWHRDASSGGASLLDATKTLHFVAVSFAAGAAPSAQKLFDALSPSTAEAAVVVAPSFALAWVALEDPSQGNAVAAAFASAAEGPMVTSHAAAVSVMTAQGDDVYDGVPFPPNQSLRFITT